MTDAAILAKLTGGALLVVGADRLHRQQLAGALGSLETVGARVLGLVLNRLAHKQAGAYSYYDYASTSETKGKSKKKDKHAVTSEPTQQPAAPVGARSSSSLSDRDDATETVESRLGTPAPTGTTRWPEGPPSGGGDARA